MLNVILSVIFILLVLSLFATTIMEVINSVFSIRGKHLLKGLNRMLASSGKNHIYEDFKQNPMYKQLTSKFMIFERPPSYLSSGMFRSILWNTLFSEGDDKNISERINEVKDDNLRTLLQQALKDADFDTEKFKANIENWYDEVMERVTGWYKRNTQATLILVGFCIALTFDADILSIYSKLSSSPEATMKTMQIVDNYFQQPGTYATPSDSLQLVAFRSEINNVMTSNLESLQEPYGLGWHPDTRPTSMGGWLQKMLGWLITALAVSLGAPFWFDLLRKIMRIRSSGSLPPQVIVAQPAPTSYRVENTVVKKSVAPALPVDSGEDGDVAVIKSYG